MNIDVPLSDRHLQVFKELLKKKKLRKSWQTWLGKNVFYLSQEQVHRLLNGEVKTTEITYRHLSRLIENLNDDENKPFRKMLAEHIIHEMCAEPPQFAADSFPFKCKINLPGDMAILRKYLVICYLLEDFEEDIGLSENIIAPDMDNQSRAYFEGYISALVHLLRIIEEVLYENKYFKGTNGIIIPDLLWFVNKMEIFNMVQWETAIDKDNSTQYDTIMCSRDEQIIDRALLQSSPSLQDVLVQFCPGRQTKLFYMGWHSFCKFFPENHFDENNGELLLYFGKNKYRILDSLDYCMDKFLEKHHPDDYSKLKDTYDRCISGIKIYGYEKCKDKLVHYIEAIYEAKQIEYILLCFCNKAKGIQVVLDLLLSNKYCGNNGIYLLEIEFAVIKSLYLRQNMRKYFGTEESAVRQIKNFKVDISNTDEMTRFVEDLKFAKKILYVYRHRNQRDRQGKQGTLAKRKSVKNPPPKSFAAINEFKNREEFCRFLQSSDEIIDYFSDSCEETNAEFLRLLLKVKKEKFKVYEIATEPRTVSGKDKDDFNPYEIVAGLRTVLEKNNSTNANQL